MGRQRKRALYPVALSLDAAAEQVMCRRKTLSDAVTAGSLGPTDNVEPWKARWTYQYEFDRDSRE